MGLGESILGLLLGASAATTFPPPCVMGDESIMSQKKHGTSHTPVQQNLRWGCDFKTADRICNFNRHYAEHSGYWQSTQFLSQETPSSDSSSSSTQEITFYDSNTGKPLFVAPRGRSFEAFVKESTAHGWPSFRDEEVIWENVRCLPDGETVSVDGTHLGHNLPDGKGSRYCINLVSVAGNPTAEEQSL
jgi:peptide methionine sulfoxide reductase MsrB